MNDETQQPDSETPDVVRSPKNTERDLTAESLGNMPDGSETVRDLVVLDVSFDDSPKNDRPVDLTMSAKATDQPEVVRKLIVIDHSSETDTGDC